MALIGMCCHTAVSQSRQCSLQTDRQIEAMIRYQAWNYLFGVLVAPFRQ
jgi:hypothetical protein